MAPDGETIGDIGLKAQNHHARKGRAAANQGERGKIPGAQIGNDQKRDEKNGGGAEIPHQGQAAQAKAGKQNKAIEIAPGE